MTCICVLTAFRPSFPHLETLKKILENSTLSRYVKKKKKKKKNPDRPTQFFKFWSGEGNITIFFFWASCYLNLILKHSDTLQKKIEWIIHSIYGVKKFHSLRSEFHSILTPVEWKVTTQRVESRPVHSIFTPKEVITDVTTQGVTSVTNKSENSLYFFFREYQIEKKKRSRLNLWGRARYAPARIRH